MLLLFGLNLSLYKEARTMFANLAFLLQPLQPKIYTPEGSKLSGTDFWRCREKRSLVKSLLPTLTCTEILLWMEKALGIQLLHFCKPVLRIKSLQGFIFWTNLIGRSRYVAETVQKLFWRNILLFQAPFRPLPIPHRDSIHHWYTRIWLLLSILLLKG